MKTKKLFLTALAAEQALYFPAKKRRRNRSRHSKPYQIWKCISALRHYEYWCKKRDSASGFLLQKYCVLRVRQFDRKRNIAGEKANIELTPGLIGNGLRICHSGVILNGHIGNSCTFHGQNVVGNKKTGASDAIPTIGNHVDVGVGAIIIGDISIADHCVIGAGAVVTKSFPVPGTIIAGVPARELPGTTGAKNASS